MINDSVKRNNTLWPRLFFRYSSANMEGSLSRQQKYDADGFSCSVAPQYWTWGNRMRGKESLHNLGSLLNKRQDFFFIPCPRIKSEI